MLIEHCRLNTGDDCICLKSGLNEDGRRVNRPTENVVVRHCRTENGHGGVVIGSDTSGGIRNVFVYDCVFDGTHRGIRIKTNRAHGGFVENIWFQDITMDRIPGEAVTINANYSAYAPAADVKNVKPPVVRNIHITNVSCKKAALGLELIGLSEQPLENITLTNVKISTEKGIKANDVVGLKLYDCDIQQ